MFTLLKQIKGLLREVQFLTSHLIKHCQWENIQKAFQTQASKR